ncbi:MAG: glutathionylspermidine synthase family protein [Candidatus Omnitrophica bacterium]|nr:glutathionylspermidine synthase family protein [Candidatus Omnitrophota bacterium]
MTTINQYYDEIVLSHPDEAREAIAFLSQEMDRRNCKFGTEILPTFLKPVFISQEERKSISEITGHLMSILDKVTRLYFSHPELNEFFYIDKEDEEVIAVDHGYTKNVMISRPDSFLVNGSLRFVEFNCDSPAGCGLCDTTEEILMETAIFKELASRYKFHPQKRSGYLLAAILEAYKEFGGKKEKPNIAIVDWEGVRTTNEFQILQALFKKKGYETIIADPRQLKLVDRRLEHKDFPIDLVYRRVIFKELMAKRDETKDFIRASREGKVCIVNPLRSRLASNKSTLAIMTNQKNFRGLFTEEENLIIKKHIPWTRRVIDMQTYYEGNQVFLKKHIISHKDQLVLKPGDSYGGKNVSIGRETDEATWTNLVGSILSNKEDWVVQRYVDISEMTVPVINGNGIKMAKKKYNINPFVFAHRYAGSVARLSDQSVINVSAGGGLVPVINYDIV